ncbi:hypothetical protein ANN_11915 [Periplaneta americana]|uniref:glycerol-3-phosphate dehydrogenase n=1 Tax=Periplaneta americana TaxID=6978 RepID=A0ABQ8T6C5_PERAM|nr:hypothetical protein ANN_11915 [Periplaneta americana]
MAGLCEGGNEPPGSLKASQMDDARMCLSVALTATRHGATVANHVKVTKLLKEKDAAGKPVLCGASLRDEVTGKEWDVRAKCIINATGPMTDTIRKMDNPKVKEICCPSSGVHIVLPGYYSEALHNICHHAVRSMLAEALKEVGFTVHQEVQGVATQGSVRRIDIIAIKNNSAYILDPTIRFETHADQPHEVDSEKKWIYEPTIPFYKDKYSLSHIDVIGLMVGAQDGRVIFFLPWLKHTIAGTTDLPCEVTHNPKPTEDEIMFILEEVKNYLNPDVEVRRGDVLSAWSGIRPLVSDPNKEDTQSLARNHIVHVSESKLVTIAGGKWTTFRAMAEHTVDAAIKACDLKPKYEKCQTDGLRVEGAHNWTPTMYIRLVQDAGLECEVAQHLAQSYGDRAFNVAKLASLTGKRWPIIGKKIHPEFPYIDAEIRYAVKEYACTAIDVIARRLRLAFLNNQAAQESLPLIIDILAEELKWSNDMKKAAEMRFLRRVKGCTRRDLIRNEDIRKELNKKVEDYKEKWREHLSRVDSERIPALIQQYQRKGKRDVKRPRKRIGEEMSEGSEIGRGVRQGCTLSPTLFNIYLEDLVKNCFQNMGGVIVGGRRLKCTRFADDMALLAEEEVILRDMLLELNDSCEQYRLKIYANKTKIMVVGGKKQFEEAQSFLQFEMGQMVNRASKDKIPINLSKDEIQSYIKRFQIIDKDRKGYVSITDIRRSLQHTGEEVSGEELHEILREIDTNMNGQVELDEYLQMMSAIKSGHVAYSRFARMAEMEEEHHERELLKKQISVERSGGGL